MLQFTVIPIAIVLALGAWFYTVATNAGVGRVASILWTIVGLAAQPLAYALLDYVAREISPAEYTRILNKYGDANLVLAEHLVAAVVAFLAGLALGKLLGARAPARQSTRKARAPGDDVAAKKERKTVA